MTAQLALELHPAGVTVYTQLSTSRTLLVEEFPDTLYSLCSSDKELYSLTASADDTPCYVFTGIVRRLLGMQISETSLLVSQCLGIAFNYMQLASRYLELVIHETLTRTSLQTKDIIHCCILVPDSLIVPLAQLFVQHFPALLSLAPVYIPQSHARALQWTLRGTKEHGLPTGLHFQIAMQLSSTCVSLVGLGTRFLSRIAAGGDIQYSTISQLSTYFHSCSRFTINVIDRMRVLCYQKLAEIGSHNILLAHEVCALRQKSVEFLLSLQKFLLDGLSCALYKDAVDFRIVLPAIKAQDGRTIPLFLSADLNEVLTLSAQESYSCTEMENTLYDESMRPISNDTGDLQLEELAVSTDYSKDEESTGIYSAIITGDFFCNIAQELIDACKVVVDSILSPLVDILSTHTRAGIRHLPPLITLYQSPSDPDPLFGFLCELLRQRYQDVESAVSLHIEQEPLKQCMSLFFNNASVFKSYVIPHYTLDIDVSYPLGRQVFQLVQDDFPSETSITCYSDREHFLKNINVLEEHLINNFRSDLSILKPVLKSIDILIEQEIDLRVAVTNTVYSPFLQDDTLHGLVLRRPLVFSQHAICLRALHITYEPTLGLGILGVRRPRNYLETCEAAVKICGMPQDVNTGIPQEKIAYWDNMKDFICSSLCTDLAGHALLSCSELLRIDLGTPVHMPRKLPEPTCRILLDVARRHVGNSVQWYVDLIINRTHAVLSIHHFPEEIHLFLTGEMHNRFITRTENINGLFKTGQIYYGLYKNRLHSIFLFDIDCLFGQEEATADQQGPLRKSRSILSPTINPAYIALMEASLNLHLGSNSEHLVRVVDILYDQEQEMRSQHAAVITELLFPLNLSPLSQFDGSPRDIWTYFQNIRIIGDLRCFVEKIGNHGFLDHRNIYYNSKGMMCTMVRPRCFQDQDFLGLSSLFGAFRTATNYITFLSSSTETGPMSDWQFLYNVASSLLPTTFSENEFADALMLYKKMYDLKGTNPITKISLIDCAMYHTIKLLQALNYPPSDQSYHCPWHINCLISDVLHSNDRLVVLSLLVKSTISDKLTNHHPAVAALEDLPTSVSNLDDIATIIRALFVYELSR